MKSLVLVSICSLFAAACGSNETISSGGSASTVAPVSFKDTTCSSNSSGSELTCSNGSVIPLPASFPSTNVCNQCLTSVVSNVASVECPNGLSFQFTLISGAQGATGTQGSQGIAGTNGTNGSSCSVGSDGWVRCTDGSAYKLIAGPQGPQGAQGVAGTAGASCTVSINSLNEEVLTCPNSSPVVINTACGDNCWSFGVTGNVYTLPTSTTVLPNFSTMTSIGTTVLPNFDVLNQVDTNTFPGTMTGLTTYFGIQFNGFIEVPSSPNSLVFFRLTSDDGSVLNIDGVQAVSNNGNHSSTAVVGSLSLAPGWHVMTLNYMQTLPTNFSLILEMSADGGNTYTVVPQDQLKFAE